MTLNQTAEVLDRELFPDVTLDQALGFHLSSRCWPAPHPDFYPAIKQAICDVADGSSSEEIELPNGRILEAGDIIDQLRLELFVQQVVNGEAFA